MITSLKKSLERFKKNQFLFEELAKRDFKKKYKRTVLGMGWSLLAPLMTLLVLNFVFGNFFGRRVPHYTIYLFCGNLLFSYFKESTTSGMSSLVSNATIFTKVNVPKYIFLLSKNVSSLINFGLTLCVFFIFVFLDNIQFGLHFIMLLYPIGCFILFNVGVGLIISAMYVFYKDMSYLYDIFTMLLMYLSAIFYTVDLLPEKYQGIFFLNPVYTYIKYFRDIVLNAEIPSPELHALCLFYALVALGAGGYIYKKYNHEFLFYV